jgi:hypothetical protein
MLILCCTGSAAAASGTLFHMIKSRCIKDLPYVLRKSFFVSGPRHRAA